MNRRTFFLSGLGAMIATEASAGHLYRGTAGYVPGWTSRYFQPYELASGGDGRVQVTVALVASLDRTRHGFGAPIRILSGYRDPRWNARIGGARRSRHLVSDAVDIDLTPFDHRGRYALMTHLLSNGFTSFGTYGTKPNLLHADMRPRAALWRRGGGRHPEWLRRALAEWKWRPVSGSPYR
ncbi:MAG: D-Ala-D-Ala carboxypeptidase family metallohydrolase [Pseudomonadota bacterium]